MELKSRDCSGNYDSQCNTSKEKKHLRTENKYNWLSVGDVAKRYSRCFVVLTGDIPEMDARREKSMAESEVRRGALRSFGGGVE